MKPRLSATRPLRIDCAGFILLPVTLALGLIASIAYLSNRDSGFNVAMVAGRADAEKARYAAEAGLEHASDALQKLGCTGYPTEGSASALRGDLGGARYLSHASGATSGSPVAVAASASYAGATAKLTRNDVIVYQTASQSFELQSDMVTGKDTYLSDYDETTNYGGETKLKLDKKGLQTLLQFDFTDLPAGSRLVDKDDSPTVPPARLALYQTNDVSGTAAVSVYLVEAPWTEGRGPGSSGGATWRTSNGVATWPAKRYQATPIASAPATDAKGWKYWDVSDAVKAWIGNRAPNHGLWLVASGANKELQFVSSEETANLDQPENLTQRPKLMLKALLPCGTRPPKQSSTAPARDTAVDAGNPDRSAGTDTLMSVSGGLGKQVVVAFDTPVLASGSKVTSARVRLYLEAATPTAASSALNLALSEATTQWAENATWNDPKTGGLLAILNRLLWGLLLGAPTSQPVSETALSQGFRAGRWVEFDASSVVKGWVDGTAQNRGLLVRNTTSANDELKFSTREAADTSRRPRLIVTYQ